MIIAQEKFKTNIIEYILYIWQIEDLIRANKFDLELIDKNIISGYNQPEEVKTEITNWYSDLISKLKSENKEVSGHISLTTDLIEELALFHKDLISKNAKYKELYSWSNPIISEFKSKSKLDTDNEIYISLHALYAIMLLRLQKKEIAEETNIAIRHISIMLGYLALMWNKK